jgi:hypothetical protein
MRIGVISEGVEDQGVIKNILIAVAKSMHIDLDVKAMRPSLSSDATDLGNPNNTTIGTFQGVKNACISKYDYERFFLLEDSSFMVIQLDTAEIDKNGLSFVRPVKNDNPNYATELRNLMIAEINQWLDSEEYEVGTLYAISIEEMEAWCLTMFENEDTVQFMEVKNRLSNHLTKKDLTYKKLKLDPVRNKSLYFETITKKHNFHKIKELKAFAQKNQSLNDFVISLEKAFLEYGL